MAGRPASVNTRAIHAPRPGRIERPVTGPLGGRGGADAGPRAIAGDEHRYGNASER
jgi:hypothetical protein